MRSPNLLAQRLKLSAKRFLLGTSGRPVAPTAAPPPSPLPPPSAAPTNPTWNPPYTKTFTGTTDPSVFGQTASASSTQTEPRTYSTEKIPSLGGSFAACKVKYDVTANGTTTTSFSWTVGSGRLKGHLLKSSTGAGVRTLEATVLLLSLIHI